MRDLVAWIVLACAGAENPPAEVDHAVVGRVIDAAGEGIAGADVRLTRIDRDLGPLSYSASRSTLSGKDGSFRFEKVASSTWLLDARDDSRYLAAPLRIVVSRDAPPIESISLELTPASAVEGVVTDEAGRPLSGVGVAVGDGGLQGKSITPVTMVDHATGERMRLPEDASYPRLPLKMAITDSTGRFRLAPVLPDVATSLRVGGLAAYHDTTISSIFAPAGGTAFVEISLSRGASITGRVLRDDGRPVADVDVSLLLLEAQPNVDAWIVLPRTDGSAGNGASRGLKTGAEGLFRFEGLDAGRYVVVAESDGFARATSSILALTKHGEVLPVEVTLAEGYAIRGTLRDPDRYGCASARIEVVESTEPKRGADSFLAPLQVAPAADGSFELRLADPTPVDLRIKCPGVPSLVLRGVDPRAAEPLVVTRTRHALLSLTTTVAAPTTLSRW